MIGKPTFAAYSSQFRGVIITGAFLLALSILCAILVVGPARAGAAAKDVYSAPSVPAGGEWQIVPTATNELLRKVSMVSSADGWAVGDNGTLLHYNVTAWQLVNISTTDTLVDVFMLGSNNGYIVGWSDTGSDVFRYNGASWALDYVAPSTLASIHASSAHNVWSVGLNISAHWDGAQWNLVPLPVQRMLFNVRVVSDTEAWAFGQYEPVSGHGLILHNTTGTWVQVPSQAPQTLFDASFTSPNDGWAVGTVITTTHVHHYDGAQWTWVYTNSLGLFHLDMLSPTEGWATGQSEAGPTIAHFYNSTFITVTDPLNRVFLNGIDMLSPCEGWIVGAEGAILHHACLSTTTPTAQASQTPTIVPTAQLSRTATTTPTAQPSRTPTIIPTTEPSRTATPTPTVAPSHTPGATPTTCPMNFSDVHPTDSFYTAVRYLYCAGVISGYADNTFRPYNDTTRGQLTKIVVLARGWPVDCPSAAHFSDVPVGSPFFCFVETAFAHGIISGYTDGAFRPGNNVTRGQLSKIIVLATGWTDVCPSVGHFSDVPVGSPFFCFVETAYAHNAISGYSDGAFRPGNNATRSQICLIVYRTLTNP